ncbi:MAG: winged helix-turn-helix transcriptional regulator, partial [Rhodospirillales bacterium]|nr:winged helix-turn-helix transcriptional regulator [Rhodospirillales bacterium]
QADPGVPRGAPAGSQRAGGPGADAAAPGRPDRHRPAPGSPAVARRCRSADAGRYPVCVRGTRSSGDRPVRRPCPLYAHRLPGRACLDPDAHVRGLRRSGRAGRIAGAGTPGRRDRPGRRTHAGIAGRPGGGRRVGSGGSTPPLIGCWTDTIGRFPFYDLVVAHRRLHVSLHARLKDLNVQVETWRGLETRSSDEKRTMGELAEVVLLSPPTLSKLVDRMVANGLVHGQPSSKDH